MSAPRAITLILLSLLLVLCLAVFGLLFSINMTALNADYVTDRLETLPISDLIEEAELDEEMEDNPEMVALIKSVITENEEGFKQRAGAAIDIIYDYLKGKSDDLDLALTLKETVMDPDFAISIVSNADLTPLAKELITDMLSDVVLPYNLSVEPYIDDMAQELEPWLKEQATSAIPTVFDYVLGLEQDAYITISLEQPTEIIRDALKQDFMQSPPAEFSGLPASELENEFDRVFDGFSGGIPDEIDVNAEFLAADAQTDFAQSMADAENAFAESRKFVGLFNLVIGLLVGFIVLIIAGIVLINPGVKNASRTLGIILSAYGFISMIVIFSVRGSFGSQIAHSEELSPVMQQWVNQSFASTLTPMLTLSIALLVIGIALLVLNFFYKDSRATEY